MKIYGLQKMTLLDFPGKVACTIFTGGCNLRCPFCHNASLVTELDDSATMTEQELLTFLKSRQGLLEGVCITGGEPLMQKDILPFIQQVRELGFAVKLDTNGCYPERLRELIEKQLVDYVAMDIKNCQEKYAETVGIADFDLTAVKQSVSTLLENKVDYEFRTTIVSEFHTVSDIQNIAKWIHGAPRYCLQNFKDSGNLIGENMHPVLPETLQDMQKTAVALGLQAEIRGL